MAESSKKSSSDKFRPYELSGVEEILDRKTIDYLL